MARYVSDPVVGWRLWRLRDGLLQAWAVDYLWEPGENRAACVSTGAHPCGAPPGERCLCGFWGLWSPSRCCDRTRGEVDASSHVMGLVAGWGTVAVHGHEGFRAERAAVRCLFTDCPATAWVPLTAGRRLAQWWRRSRGRAAETEASDDVDDDPRRLDALREVAARYAVPLVSLRGSVSLGLLREWGIPRAQIAEARELVATPTRLPQT